MATEMTGRASDYTVVISVDESPQAEHAFDWYMTHVYKKGHRVLVVHAIAQPIIMYAEISGVAYSRIMAEARQEGKQIIDLYSSKLKLIGVSATYLSGMSSCPGEWVAGTAKKERASLMVVGSRGKNVLKRHVLGSHSDYLLHHTHCPIAVCHMPDNTSTK